MTIIPAIVIWLTTILCSHISRIFEAIGSCVGIWGGSFFNSVYWNQSRRWRPRKVNCPPELQQHQIMSLGKLSNSLLDNFGIRPSKMAGVRSFPVLDPRPADSTGADFSVGLDIVKSEFRGMSVSAVLMAFRKHAERPDPVSHQVRI
jgi:hypothetical protein